MVDAKHVIPTCRWVHLAGVYGSGGMSLYMNGELIGQKAASGVIGLPDKDVLIGLKGDPQRISDPVSHSNFAANNNLPIRYGMEGLIDEVKIYDCALSHTQIQQAYRDFLPPAEDIDNPCLVIGHWTGAHKSRLVLNDVEMEPGKSFRQGLTRDVDGTMTLVVGVEFESVSPVRFVIEDGEG